MNFIQKLVNNQPTARVSRPQLYVFQSKGGASIKLLACLLLLMSLSSCANKPQPQAYETPQRSHPLRDISFLTDREKADLYEAIIAADMASAQGDHKTAVSFYLAAANISKDREIIQLLIQSASKAGDSLALLQAADIWLDQQPNAIDAIQLRVSALLLMQDLKQAVSVAERLFLLQHDSAKLTGLLNQISRKQSPPIINAFYISLLEKYPLNLSLMTSQAYFLVAIAPKTKTPESIFKQAYSILEQVLSIKSNFLPAIELKTKLLYQSRQMQKAEAFLRQLSSENPDSSIINELLGQLLYDLRRYDLAIQHYQHWLKKHPKDIESHFYLAASYFATSQYEKSLKHYQQILGKGYKNDLTYFFCGNTASQLKQYAQAVACYDQVIAGEHVIRAKIEQAKIYALTGQIEPALKTLRNPKWASDENAEIRLISIEIEILAQHVGKQKAIDRLEQAIQKYPTNIVLLYRKITLKQLSNKAEEVLAVLQGGRNQLTDPSKVHPYNLDAANVLRSLKLYQLSIDWLNQALSIETDDPDYLYARTMAKEPLKRYDEMIADFKHLLKIDPDNAEVKNALGYTLVDLNREIDYARQLINQAFQQLPESPAVIDSKGWLAFREGDYSSALNYLHHAFRLSPNPEVAVHIGEVYWAMGDKDNALKFWHKAQSLDHQNSLLESTIKRLKVSW
ncbi:MAG: tetratricopeptide repeat protein [Enterobacterales bacterium]|nr:tetratricopeptide repeat protein [Enterobacterales bacterium]